MLTKYKVYGTTEVGIADRLIAEKDDMSLGAHDVLDTVSWQLLRSCSLVELRSVEFSHIKKSLI